jgi:hypothetical protein
VGSLSPQCVDRQVVGSAEEPAARLFRHTAPGPNFQRLHERRLNDVLDEIEPAHPQRPGQYGAEPPKLVPKKVLYQRPRFAHA